MAMPGQSPCCKGYVSLFKIMLMLNGRNVYFSILTWVYRFVLVTWYLIYPEYSEWEINGVFWYTRLGKPLCLRCDLFLKVDGRQRWLSNGMHTRGKNSAWISWNSLYCGREPVYLSCCILSKAHWLFLHVPLLIFSLG